MLPQEIKEQIQSVYRQMLESRGLTPREGQRRMIAEIARCLGEISPAAEDDEPGAAPGPVCAIEAGTGTGKTLAYLLAVLPMAQALKLKVVIATATVALQEQVLQKDIPELMQGSGLRFTPALAKGRGRYLCLTRLQALLQGEDDDMQMLMTMYADEPQDMPPEDPDLYQDMQAALADGSWQGDRDDWKTPIPDRDWQRLTMDNAGCMGPKCSNYQDCCFYQARGKAEEADCIVTNQDLLLSDLALGGGAILPAPPGTIYIVDEAHHLPHKSNSHFAAFTKVKGTLDYLERLQRMVKGLAGHKLLNEAPQNEFQSAMGSLREQVEQTWELLQQIIEQHEDNSPRTSKNNKGSKINKSPDESFRLAFSHGVVPDGLRDAASNMQIHFTRLNGLLRDLAEALRSASEGMGSDETSTTWGTGAAVSMPEAKAGQWFPVVWAMAKRAETALNLWQSFAHRDEPETAPTARWLSIESSNRPNRQPEAKSADITLSSAPVLAARNLQESLWGRCAGAVLTSATLTALGSFDMFRLRAGLPEHSLLLRIPSPFPFTDAACFQVPRLRCEPSQTERHTALIAAALPRLLAEDEAALMLFSSRRQMQGVLAGLPADWRQERVLCQDDYQKARLLALHRQRVDQGLGSVIFGLASFAEGVDLPGRYCTHVLIAKIPFAVPDDPLETTLSQWMEGQGHNPFMSLTVPDAAFRLVQASGRLLRHEEDTGYITLFDERIVSKRYGKAILDSLPPYRRELLTLDLADCA